MSDSEVIETSAGPARLRRSARKTLAISVHPDGSVELAAPYRASLGKIREKVTKRTAWIRHQQRLFLTMNAKRMPPRYSSGATHRYLGRQYRLKIRKGKVAGVKLSGAFFHVTTQSDDRAEVQVLLAAWMRQRASEQLERRIERWRDWCERHGLPRPRAVLRSMPKRWGSAYKDGRIAFNPDLVRTPSTCIDYVVAHEIGHLKHPNHSPDFYRLLNKLFPDWQNTKRRLEMTEA